MRCGLRRSAAAVVAVVLAAGHGRDAAGFAALARLVVLGDHPRHARGHALAHRDVQELVRAMRVRMRAEHAGDEELPHLMAAFGDDSSRIRAPTARSPAIAPGAACRPSRVATREASRLLRIDDRLGTLEPGKLADIVAVAGDPLADISKLRSVAFVMKEGVVYKGP